MRRGRRCSGPGPIPGSSSNGSRRLPYTTPVAELDVRPGGANLVVMRGPEGNDMPNRGVYLEVVENERLVFTDAYTKAWEPSQKPFMTVILTFEDMERKNAVHRPCAPLDRRRPRGARKDGLSRRLGTLRRPACGCWSRNSETAPLSP